MEKKTKVNIPILIATLCVAFCLILTGALIDTADTTGEKPSASVSDGQSSYISVFEKYSWNGSYQTGKTLTFKFTPTSTDEYFVKADGVSIDSVKTEGGRSVTVYSEARGAYDVCKSVYLTGDTTYYINVTTNRTYQTVYITDSN